MFFIEYRKQYLLFKTQIVADNRGKPWVDDDKKISRYVQLLLGRIMFLHFIEKKGWLDGNRDFIRNLFEQFRLRERRSCHPEVPVPLFFRSQGSERGGKTTAGGGYDSPVL